MTEIDEAAGIEEVERYTYVYDQNTQQLDHIFISPGLVARGVEAEHIHVCLTGLLRCNNRLANSIFSR